MILKKYDTLKSLGSKLYFKIKQAFKKIYIKYNTELKIHKTKKVLIMLSHLSLKHHPAEMENTCLRIKRIEICFQFHYSNIHIFKFKHFHNDF